MIKALFRLFMLISVVVVQGFFVILCDGYYIDNLSWESKKMPKKRKKIDRDKAQKTLERLWLK